MVYRVLVQAPGTFERAVVHLDAGDVLRRNSAQFIVRNFELHDMPSIQTNAAIRRAGSLHELKRILQTSDHGEWHQLEAHPSSTFCRISAQSSESLDQVRH